MKSQLTIATNFISSKDSEEESSMHSNSCNIKCTPYSDAKDVNEKIFKSLGLRHQENINEWK